MNNKPSKTPATKTDRRLFLKSASALTAFGMTAASGINSSAFGATKRWSKNEKLRTAHIGVGGMGASDLGSIASHAGVEIAAICDVDSNTLAKVKGQHKSAAEFVDFREMLTQLTDKIDAVVVSTPDHTHAPAAMLALSLGKPVYCQKPLTHEVFEARRLREIAEENSIVTQMGIQIHSHGVYRRAVKMIQDGVIGKVSQVFAWSNKNWGYDGGELGNTQPAPDSLEWDLWLGTANDRDYVPKSYHPGNWRKLIDFGTGTLGDMGVHIFDTPYAALKLTAPKSAKTTCRQPSGIGHPEKNIVEYIFPGTDYTTETLKWTWFDGAEAPPKNDKTGLPDDVKLPGQGSLFIGEQGSMMLPHIGESQLYPREKFADYKRPELTDQNHYHQWVDACMGEGETSASFSYGGPLTEALLLGVVANRFPNVELAWDAENMKITNVPEAELLLKRAYRSGFEVEGL